MPGLGQLLLLAEQLHSPACGSYLHLQEPTISHGLILQLERVSVHPHWDLYGGRGWLPPALSVLTSSPCPLCSTSHERAHTHTHMHTPSSPEILEKGPGGGTLGAGWARQSWHHPAPCFNPPSHGRPAICCRSEVAIWRGDLCSLCWIREKGERDRLAASGPCACACLGTEMNAQPRGTQAESG